MKAKKGMYFSFDFGRQFICLDILSVENRGVFLFFGLGENQVSMTKVIC